jgi:uncharacterized membrane protein YheB (UPF0754 family)
MDLVNPKNSLADHISVNTVKNNIVTKISSIPNYISLKYDLELIKYISNLIENMIPNKTKKTLDKPSTIIDIMSSLFSLSDQDKSILSQSITFLMNNKHVKTSSMMKIVTTSVGGWIKKKIL